MSESPTPRKSPITTTVESPESWQRVVKIEADRELYDKVYAKRLKKAVKSHQKPGFRKGRTPRALVEKEVGDILRMEAIEEIIQQAWTVGLLENRLQPLTDPALENFKFEDEGPMTFDLKVEVRPEVKAENYEGIPVKQREIEVKDSDVDEVLERLRESRATFVKVDRASREGDQVTLDLTPEAWDGEPDANKVLEGQKLIVGGEGNMAAFNEAIEGVEAGQEKEVSVTYPEEHPSENLKGKTITFMCRIQEVAAKELPELDDELAAEVSGGKTLAELKDSIRQDLTKEMENRVAQEMDQQILRSLVGRNSVDLPPSMVEDYIKSSIEEMHRRNLQMGRPNNEAEDAEYREAGRPHAEMALKGMLLLGSVRQQEGIKVTEEDVDERIEEIAREHGFEVDRYREFINSGDEKDRMMYDMLERRTYDFLLSRAEIASVSADSEVLAEEE
ncbi:trigger factor [bacterium DOLJORAL78_65_58]|nr:MAG: trigger factor [bacterium DOLZORAL124_64_63]PIE76309.1 MAG: trigger factor [bacterium DOLJORAL78_65_58]